MLEHKASSLEDQESVGVVHVEVQYAYAQLTSLDLDLDLMLTLDVTHVIKSSRGSKVARIINAYSPGNEATYDLALIAKREASSVMNP